MHVPNKVGYFCKQQVQYTHVNVNICYLSVVILMSNKTNIGHNLWQDCHFELYVLYWYGFRSLAIKE